MTINRYQWPAPSPVSQLAIRQDQSQKSAYIIAAPDADAQLFSQLPKQLEAMGLQVFADQFNGQDALHIRDLGANESQLMQLLQQGGYTKGAAEQIEKEAAPTRKLGEWFADNSIIASGLTYLVADGLGYASGHVRGDKDGMRMGLAFASTSILLTLFGTPNSKRQMQNVYAQVDDFIQQEGIDVELGNKHLLHSLKGNTSSPIRKVANFLSDNLIAINNVGQGIGGVYNFKAGINQSNPLKTTAGAAITIGQWGALAIPEDLTAGMNAQERTEYIAAERRGERPEPKELSMLEQPWQWLQQKPLRLTGIGTRLHNVLTASGGIMEYRRLSAAGGGKHQSKSGALMDIGAQFVNLAANTMYGMSPKDRRGHLKEDGYVDEMTSVAAAIYANIPEEDRSSRIEQFAEFIADMPEMKSGPEEIQQAVEGKIAALAQNPWAQAESKTPPQAEKSGWADKVANENHAPTQAISV